MKAAAGREITKDMQEGLEEPCGAGVSSLMFSETSCETQIGGRLAVSW
jgi:hypothetical protein